MQIDIVAVGRLKAGPEQELYGRFAERFAKAGRGLHLRGPELIEISESRARDVTERKREEAEAILARLAQGTRIVALDENGRDYDSKSFSALIVKEQEAGTSNLAFAIGGPDGHGEALLQAASLKLRFGSWTWPHQIARVMLAEQLYRATTILSGHPYHRA